MKQEKKFMEVLLPLCFNHRRRKTNKMEVIKTILEPIDICII